MSVWASTRSPASNSDDVVTFTTRGGQRIGLDHGPAQQVADLLAEDGEGSSTDVEGDEALVGSVDDLLPVLMAVYQTFFEFVANTLGVDAPQPHAVHVAFADGTWHTELADPHLLPQECAALAALPFADRGVSGTLTFAHIKVWADTDPDAPIPPVDAILADYDPRSLSGVLAEWTSIDGTDHRFWVSVLHVGDDGTTGWGKTESVDPERLRRASG